MTPTVGRIVLVPMDPAMNNGSDVAPAVITRVWDDGSVNVHVLPDGNVTEWRTSLVQVDDLADRGDSQHVWMWPPRV
jgi:hypothetical protein